MKTKMRNRFSLLFLCTLLIFPIQISSQGTDTLSTIDGIFSHYHNGMPGVAVAIARNGKTIYNKAFGLADLEHMVPNTTGTIFECGSVSKQFTAASVLLLAQEGKLSLNDDVRKYVPELPQYDAPITIQHLLSHTSGLKDWGALFSLTGWSRTTRVYTQELGYDIVFRQKSLNFTPGSQYSYSNSNYVLLTLIVERVSGKSLAAFTAEKLFNPLGMNNTQWRDDYRKIVPGRAVAYSGSDGRYLQNMPFENLHGPGGLLTTTADLLRWNQLLESNELFTSEMARRRIQPGLLNNGQSSGYAAGLMIGTFNSFNEVSHSGSTAGYRAWLAWYPEYRLSIAILSNYASFNPTTTGRQIAAVFLGKSPVQDGTTPSRRISLDEKDLNRWTGTYFSDNTHEIFTINVRDGNLYAGTQRLRAVHRDTVYRGNQWYAASDNNERLTSGTDILKRMKPAKTDILSLQEYAGTYYCEDVDVNYKLEVRNGELWIYRMAGNTYKLSPAFFDAFLSGSNGLYYFTRDRRGKINGFSVSISRADNVGFKKM